MTRTGPKNADKKLDTRDSGQKIDESRTREFGQRKKKIERLRLARKDAPRGPE